MRKRADKIKKNIIFSNKLKILIHFYQSSRCFNGI